MASKSPVPFSKLSRAPSTTGAWWSPSRGKRASSKSASSTTASSTSASSKTASLTSGGRSARRTKRVTSPEAKIWAICFTGRGRASGLGFRAQRTSSRSTRPATPGAKMTRARWVSASTPTTTPSRAWPKGITGLGVSKTSASPPSSWSPARASGTGKCSAFKSPRRSTSASISLGSTRRRGPR